MEEKKESKFKKFCNRNEDNLIMMVCLSLGIIIGDIVGSILFRLITGPFEDK